MITNNLHVVTSLCRGCGVCAGICPCDAITMEQVCNGVYIPNIDAVKCTSCGLCMQSCPAFGCIEEEPVKQLSDNDLVGSCLGAYAAYSTDEVLRYKAASGGFVTSLLLYALDVREIDAAVVVVSSRDDPFASCAVIARDRETILRSFGSRYLPVEFSAVLRQVIRDNSIKRVGVVGLPCHIDGIKRASLVIPRLSQKIAFTIALFCKQTKDLRFTDMVLAKMKVKRDLVREIKFRGDGWPGEIQVTLKNGGTVRYPYEAFNSLWGTFSCTPMCCLLCTSPMGDVADISVGDAWLDQYRKNKMGVSLVLVRSEAGKKIVDHALQDGRIWMEAASLSRILDAQPRFIIMAKKSNSRARLKILSRFDRRVGRFFLKKDARPVTLNGYGEALWVMGTRYLASTTLFRKLFPYLPSFVLKVISRGTIEVWRLFVRWL